MAEGKTLTQRLDALYEFDREPVTENKLHGPAKFMGLYAGEHVAGTEFIIGALFVTHGVTAMDMFLGLFLGNLLAVLSWAFVCAPIAVNTRLNMYWQARKIAGPGVTFVYNIVNALMFCFLAGSMISVAATAIGLPFGMQMPTLQDMYPNSVQWVVVVFLVGSVVTVLAILGFEKISEFGQVAAPWMFLVFVAAAIAVLPILGVHSLGEFWSVANEKIWTGVPVAGQSKFTIWHVMFFAWFANLAMHLGMADMSILRYAKKWQYGFFSAFGMYLGHYVAWLTSGIMCAAALGNIAPGPIAYLGAGVAGAMCVVIAGWTTANPTIYRAGLALQTVTPNWSRWKVTLAVGVITTIAAMFPALMMKLLDFVALYGLLLMPMGAVIFADFWLLPRLGLQRNFAEAKRLLFSWPAGLAWLVTLALAFDIPLQIYFKSLPGWFIAVIVFIIATYVEQKLWQKQQAPKLKKRPRSVEIIAWSFIALSIIRLTAFLAISVYNHTYLSRSLYFIISMTVLLFQIILGISLLQGQNWSRIVLLWLMPISLAFVLFTSNIKIIAIPDIIWTIIFADYFTRSAAVTYFKSRN